MLKNIFILLCFLFLTVFKLYSQQKFCADSSIRLKYTTAGDPFSLLINPDTSGKNIFSGSFTDASHPVLGIMAIKTNWGDSIYWAKKYYSDNDIYLGSQNCFAAPEGTVVLTGERRYFSTNTFVISRIDTNGNMLWTRHFPFMTGNPTYLMSSNFYMKNIFVTDNAIYFGIHLSFYDVVGKLDLNGNLLWSRGFAAGNPPSSPANSIADGLFEKNGIIYFASNTVKNDPLGNSSGVAITQLSDTDGSLLESTFYRIIPDTYAKGFQTRYIYPYKDGTFSLIGNVGINTDPYNSSPQPNTRFNVQMDGSLNPLPGYYYKTTKALDATFQFDMNAQKHSAFLCNIPTSLDKYFISFNHNQDLIRSRKYTVPSNPFGGLSDINVDDKQNIHFIYNYILNNQSITEYARLSDLAPTNTLQCFGIDTASIFDRYPFLLTKESYTWPFQNSNLVNCLPVNIYTEDVIIIKEVVCKQVSYCDSIKIRGTATICIPGMDIRYSTYLNPQCLKARSWQVDSSYASIVNMEGDTAVTLRYKKVGQFYLKALVNNCVVADSMLITITTPQNQLGLTKSDTIICPGKNILLSVNAVFRSYQWQDGSTLSTYNVTSAGLYRIKATDSCGNIVRDSIRITNADTSISVASRYTICPYDSAALLMPADLNNITWQPTGSGLLNGNTLLLYPLQTTSYAISAKRLSGCDASKTITVAVDNCPEWIRFPSAFTPDNNGLNDLLRPSVSGKLMSYSLKIFERNGQVIFSSRDPYAGWDGTLKGTKQNSGIYVYLCHYRFHNKPEKMLKGTIMLIR